jgi:hypothetical protein
MNQVHPPHYLCDTDVVDNSIPSSDILGLAVADPVVEQLAGIAHTYCVSSCVWFAHGCIQHQKSFESFQFFQILGLKNVLQ